MSQKKSNTNVKIVQEKIIEPKIKDGLFINEKGVAKALAQFSAMGAKMNRKAVTLAKTTCYIIENNVKRELTTQEASAFVRSGYTNPAK